MFTHDFKMQDSAAIDMAALEAGMVSAIDSMFREIEGGQCELEIIRRRRTLVDGSQAYVDVRMAYGERCILVSHMSTGDQCTDELEGRIPFMGRRLLGELEETSSTDIRELTFFDPLCNVLSSRDVGKYRIDLISVADGTIVGVDSDDLDTTIEDYSEGGLVELLTGYGRSFAKNDERVVSDEPIMFGRRIEDGSLQESRLFKSNGFILVTHRYFTNHALHPTDRLIHGFNRKVLGSFEGQYAEMMDDWNGNQVVFEGFGDSVHEAVESQKEEVFEEYKRELFMEMNFEGVPPEVMRRLKRTYGGGIEQMEELYKDLRDRTAWEVGVNGKLRPAAEKVNRHYAPLSVIFDFDLFTL